MARRRARAGGTRCSGCPLLLEWQWAHARGDEGVLEKGTLGCFLTAPGTMRWRGVEHAWWGGRFDEDVTRLGLTSIQFNPKKCSQGVHGW